MNRKAAVTGVVGLLIGFIVGFFSAQTAHRLSDQDAASAPEAHPSAEEIENIEELKDLARANPDDEQVRVMLGNLYYDMGRFDAAIDWYEESVGLNPANPDVRTDLGTAYLYTGDTSRAISMFQTSLAIEPNHLQTLQNLGFAYFSIRQFSEAVQNWQKLITTHPSYPHTGELRKQIEKAKAHLRGDQF